MQWLGGIPPPGRLSRDRKGSSITHFRPEIRFRLWRRLRRADGEYRWHHVRAEPLRDQQGTSSSGMACLLTSMMPRRPKTSYAAAKPIWRKHRG